MPLLWPPEIQPGETREEFEKRIRALELGSGMGTGADADTVDGLHASASPVANKLLALDASAKFSENALYIDGGNTNMGGATSKYVSSSIVAADTMQCLTFRANAGGVNFWIVEINNGSSFRVSADTANSTSFDWLVIKR